MIKADLCDVKLRSTKDEESDDDVEYDVIETKQFQNTWFTVKMKKNSNPPTPVNLIL